MLKPDEEERLIAAWQRDGHVPSRDRVVAAYARLSYAIAARYASNEDHVQDLAQWGSFGVLKALDQFDPTRGTKFSTYCRLWIQNFVASATSGVVNVVTVPSRAFIDARMGRLPPGRNDAAVAASQASVALDAPIGQDGGTVLDMMACPRPTPEDEASAHSQQGHYERRIWAAMSRLRDREREVVRRRRLVDSPETLDQIAADLGVTRERVRQIEVAAVEKLRRELEADGFGTGIAS